MRDHDRVHGWHHGEALLESARLAHWATDDVPPHVHADFQISVELTGCVDYHLGRQRLRVGRGQVVIIPPGVRHAMTDPGPRHPFGAFRLMFIPATMIAQLGVSPMDLMGGACLIKSPRFAADFLHYHQTSERGGPRLGQDEQLASWLHRVTRELGRPPAPSPRRLTSADSGQRLDRVRSRLLDDLRANPSLPELAASVGLTPTELSRGFRSRFGLPPHRFLLTARIDRAKRMLAKGTPINMVAVATGFADQAHLTRQFKRLAQVTPGRYARLAETFKT